jgi:hypothetical protein
MHNKIRSKIITSMPVRIGSVPKLVLLKNHRKIIHEGGSCYCNLRIGNKSEAVRACELELEHFVAEKFIPNSSIKADPVIVI